jgi:hypothetical protein
MQPLPAGAPMIPFPENGRSERRWCPWPNKPLERTAHPAGFFRLLRHRHGWAAAHRRRWALNQQIGREVMSYGSSIGETV